MADGSGLETRIHDDLLQPPMRESAHRTLIRAVTVRFVAIAGPVAHAGGSERSRDREGVPHAPRRPTKGDEDAIGISPVFRQFLPAPSTELFSSRTDSLGRATGRTALQASPILPVSHSYGDSWLTGPVAHSKNHGRGSVG